MGTQTRSAEAASPERCLEQWSSGEWAVEKGEHTSIDGGM